MTKKMLQHAVYGAAIGDALGVPYEFRGRGSFSCMDMIGGGTHGKNAGIWSDDTAMMLACADSIRVMNKIDLPDMSERFRNWAYRGDYAIDRDVFDIGITVSNALSQGKGMSGERDNGNGSLMRILPLVFTEAGNDEIADVSAITHAHRISKQACVCYVGIARAMLGGSSIQEAIDANIPDSLEFARLSELSSLSESDIRSNGYVVHTLEAALWCLLHSGSYRECVLAAVNLGEDTDTTACVAGGLAAIAFGLGCLPKSWVEILRGKDIIDKCLFGEDF